METKTTKKATYKSQILDWVEKQSEARYTDIIKFAYELKWGPGSFMKYENRRGYYSGGFEWAIKIVNGNREFLPKGHLVKPNKQGWLEKQANGKYKTVRPTN